MATAPKNMDVLSNLVDSKNWLVDGQGEDSEAVYFTGAGPFVEDARKQLAALRSERDALLTMLEPAQKALVSARQVLDWAACFIEGSDLTGLEEASERAAAVSAMLLETLQKVKGNEADDAEGSTEEVPELLPCPFCGSPGAMERIAQTGQYYPRCSGGVVPFCLLTRPPDPEKDGFLFERDAITAWNRRPVVTS